MAQPPSRPEARRRFGSETANELGAPVASSIPEQLPGREPASTRKGYEDGNALFRWYRRVEGAHDRIVRRHHADALGAAAGADDRTARRDAHRSAPAQ